MASDDLHVDWDAIPDSTLLPEDLYMLEVDELTDTTSKAGQRMYRGVFTVADGGTPSHVPYVGTALYDYFVVGTEADPKGTNAETQKNSIGLRRMKRLFKATQIPFATSVAEMVELAKGQRFVAAVSQEVDDGVKDAKYKGVKRNRINAMYPVGTQVPGSATVTAPQPAASPSKPTATAPRSVAKPTAAPTVPCPFCNTAIPRATYSQHIKDVHPDEA